MSFVYKDERNILPKNRFIIPSVPIKLTKFRLEPQNKDIIYKPCDRQFTFYQICQFPINNMYSVRKFIYNELGEMITYREKKLKKDILDKFLKKSQKYKYMIYPAYYLDIIGFPEANEILTVKSQILNEY